jgi:hypothetical protein
MGMVIRMKALKSVLEIAERILHPLKTSNLMARRRVKAEATSKSTTTVKALRCEGGAHLCDILNNLVL